MKEHADSGWLIELHSAAHASAIFESQATDESDGYTQGTTRHRCEGGVSMVIPALHYSARALSVRCSDERGEFRKRVHTP